MCVSVSHRVTVREDRVAAVVEDEQKRRESWPLPHHTVSLWIDLRLTIAASSPSLTCLLCPLSLFCLTLLDPPMHVTVGEHKEDLIYFDFNDSTSSYVLLWTFNTCVRMPRKTGCWWKMLYKHSHRGGEKKRDVRANLKIQIYKGKRTIIPKMLSQLQEFCGKITPRTAEDERQERFTIDDRDC